MDAEQQDMLLEFIAESRESLDSLEPMFIELEHITDGEQRAEAINTIFRSLHSLKGGAGFLNLDTVKDVTHDAETLLQLLRKDPTLFIEAHSDLLTKTCDFLYKVFEQIEIKFHDEGFESEAELLLQDFKHYIANIKGVGSPEAQSSEAQNLEVSTTPIPEETVPLPEAEEITPIAAEPEAPVEKTPPLPEEHTNMDQIKSELASELMSGFVTEGLELLETAEGALLVLEQLSGDVDVQEFIDTIFRSLHTIKGNAGLIGIDSVERLSHQAETILSYMKLGTLSIESELIQLFLRVVDVLSQSLTKLGEGELPDTKEYSEILAKLKEYETSEVEETPVQQVAKPESLPEIEPQPEAQPEPEPQPQPKPEPEIMTEPKSTQSSSSVTKEPTPAKPKAPESAPESAATASKTNRQSAIRVNLGKIDELVNLVGELVISGAMVSHSPDLEGLSLERFESATHQLNKNIRDLQELAMQMRMVPVAQTFKKMIRVVHDVSKKVTKKVNLKIIGEDTEIDKTVIEQIADPLLHIIRNAVDHGIELPEERVSSGKSKVGTIRLEAKHSGSEVWIIIQDDGKGLNREKILERAVERGLVGSEQKLTDDEVWKLIFEPGFSTAEAVTDLSGRGVGMDVVKRNVEKLRGRIDVTSEAGKGSSIILRIPLTLAIIDGMLIRVGDLTYALPIVAIQESLQPTADNTICTDSGVEMVKIRGNLIPVLRLHKVHDIEPEHKELTDGILVVLEDSDKQLGLFVDEMIGQQQVVIKTIPEYLGNIPHISGCTIMGNGDISLILDSISLINLSKS